MSDLPRNYYITFITYYLICFCSHGLHHTLSRMCQCFLYLAKHQCTKTRLTKSVTFMSSSKTYLLRFLLLRFSCCLLRNFYKYTIFSIKSLMSAFVWMHSFILNGIFIKNCDVSSINWTCMWIQHACVICLMNQALMNIICGWCKENGNSAKSWNHFQFLFKIFVILCQIPFFQHFHSQ